jgi:bile acid:Na+ symporter, BASS family
MDKLKQLLCNRNFIMSFALIAGLLWDGGAYFLKSSMLPLLALVMTFSTMSVTGKAFRSIRIMIVPILTGIMANFVFYGTLLLMISWIFVKNEVLWEGFVILAAMPPAVAVIPFSIFLKGDTNFALFGTIGGYLGALVLTPLLVVSFLGAGFVSPLKVFIILLELIVCPLILSRILIKTGAARYIEPVKGALINWCLFLVIYTMVGLNRNIFLQEPSVLVLTAFIAFMSTFFFGWLIEYTGKMLKIERRVLTSIILLGTCKNYGLAGGLSLVFFNPETAIPSTVASVVGIVYIIYMEWRINRLPA